MKRLILVGVLAALAVTLSVAGATAAGGSAGSTAGGSPKDTLRGGITDLPSPLGLKQRELVKEAVQLKLQGKIPMDAKVAKVGNDKGPKGSKKDKKAKKQKAKFVQLKRTGEDTIWSVLMQFRNGQPTHNHGDPAQGGFGNINHAGTRRPDAQPDCAAQPRAR